MTDLELSALADQVNAHRRDITNAVARHYTTMLETGMDPKHAVKLTRDYQADLLALSSDAELVIHMDGGD